MATGNVGAMTRFGYARDGKIVFDEVDYAFVEDVQKIPAEPSGYDALTKYLVPIA
jgi:hypothetical protein